MNWFSTMVPRELNEGKNKIGPLSHIINKIIELNERAVKIINTYKKEDMGINFYALGLSSDFLGMLSKVQVTKISK